MSSRELAGSLDRYLKRFGHELGKLRRVVSPTLTGKYTALSYAGLIRVAAEQAEKSEEFKTLQVLAAAVAQRKPEALVSVHALEHFFRRSGAYLAIAEGKDVSPEPLAEKLEKALTATGSIRVRHLVSLPWAAVEGGNLPIDAGWIRLRRYTAQELAALFENKVRLVFYPESALDSSELQLLSMECWLEVDDSEVLRPPGFVAVDFGILSGALTFTDLPPKLEQALAIVILLGWEAEQPDRSSWWSGLPLGTRFTLRESLFERPSRLIPGAHAFDILDSQPELSITQYRCHRIRELPALAQRVEALLASDEARFIPQTVLRYLLKAALGTGGPSKKVDQLVNHVIAMDALVGQAASAGRGAIARRIAALVGDTAGQAVQRRVRDLYELRSALLHGGHKEEVEPGLSWAAHELAVRATRRAIDFFFSCEATGQNMTRSEFVAFLELMASSTTAARIKELAERWGT